MFGSKVEFDPAPSIGSREIIGYSRKRESLTFIAPSIGRVTLSDNPVTADGNGLVLLSGMAPVRLIRQEHGDVVQHSWFALYSAGASPVGWIQALS